MWTEPQRRQAVQLWLCKTLEHVNKSVKAGSRSERRERWKERATEGRKETSEGAKMWPCSDDGCAQVYISQNCAKCTKHFTLTEYQLYLLKRFMIYIIFKLCVYMCICGYLNYSFLYLFIYYYEEVP